MFHRDPENLHRIADVVGQIAREVALAQPGKDLGLLPVNCLLHELQASADKLPPEMAAAIGRALVVVDEIFHTSCAFDADSINRLSDWASWMNGAILDALNDRPLTPLAQTASVASTVRCEDEPALLLDLDNDRELLVEFCAEAREHLLNIEQGVLVLEQSPTDADTLNTIFRAFHTFKGTAGLLKLHPVEELAHELETVLELARTRKLTVNRPVIELLLAGSDALRRFIDVISARAKGKTAGPEIKVPTRDLLARVRAVAGGGATTPTSAHSSSSPKPAAATHAHAAPNSGVIKVDTLKLDTLMELVGELVIAQSQVCQDVSVTAVENQRLTRKLAQLSRITKELQRNALSLRMVPVRATFQKMIRLVRDVSSQQGKQIKLLLQGEDTELDRTLVEEIADPLVHLIRNSIDHGIEPPEERVSAGKNPVGTIWLSAFHRGGNIVIQVQDDGRGLNPQKLLARARERGLITGQDRLTEREAWALIFAAGFSTAESVTEISGRGVGMDVVRRNIEKLRGKIGLESTPGQGTTFTLSLPLTLAIIDGLIVAVGEQRFILPTLSVREALRPRREMLATTPEQGEMVNVRGQLIPLLRLHEFYDVNPRTTDPTEALLVVVESNGRTKCLLVDELLGKQEIVIKSLGDTFRQAPAIAGGAILGDGRVGLILDANALVSLRPFPGFLAA